MEQAIRADDTDEARRWLVIATAAAGAIGAVASAVPFIASMAPSERARSAGAPVTVELAPLAPGQQMTVEWRGKPVWILRRTPQMIEALNSTAHLSRLADPLSRVEQQPAYATNAWRSAKPEFSILVALCAHLGCIPTFRPDVAPADLGPDWHGGYYCPCHGSRFDLAGRVFRNVPAPTNLVVPPHRYLAETLVEIGADGAQA
ncbi:MAG: ubiquinol-cytochrome c reductase iron-sulfur subunit [Rhodocyclaceae bacterium]